MGQALSIPSRREFLTICGGAGIASSFFVGALYALAAATQNKPVTAEIIDHAAELAGITILPEQRLAMLSQLQDQRKNIEKVREVHLTNNVPPAFRFDPLLGLDFRFGAETPVERLAKAISVVPASANGALPAGVNPATPTNLEDLAFASVRELGELIRQKKVSSLALTEMYLARLKRFDPKLHFVITLTEERAKAQANNAEMRKIFNGYDIVMAKSSGNQLTVTNLTGHPSVIVPNGLRKSDAPKPPEIDTGDDDSIGGPGTPVSITFGSAL